MATGCFSCELEHLDFVLDHILRQHAVAEVLNLVPHGLHRVFVVPEDSVLLRVAEEEFRMVATRRLVQIVREHVQNSHVLRLHHHLLPLYLITAILQLLLSAEEGTDPACSPTAFPR